jgi:hypothetical protein
MFRLALSVALAAATPAIAYADQPTAADKRYIGHALNVAKMRYEAAQAEACGLRSDTWKESVETTLTTLAHGFAVEDKVSAESEDRTNTIMIRHQTPPDKDMETCTKLISAPDLAVLDKLFLDYPH